MGKFLMVPSDMSAGWHLYVNRLSKQYKIINGKRKLSDETKLIKDIVGYDMSLCRCMEHIIHHKLSTVSEVAQAQRFIEEYEKVSNETIKELKNGLRQK